MTEKVQGWTLNHVKRRGSLFVGNSKFRFEEGGQYVEIK